MAVSFVCRRHVSCVIFRARNSDNKHGASSVERLQHVLNDLCRETIVFPLHHITAAIQHKVTSNNLYFPASLAT